MKLFFTICALLMTFTIQAQESEPTNKHFWHSLQIESDPQTIWRIWTDVSNWKTWDTGLKDASLKGGFVLGNKGKIISLEDRKSKFEIVEMQDGVSYTFKTKLPLSSLYVKRSLEEIEGGIRITHEVWFKGLTAGIFARAFGGDFKNMLPEVMQNIKKLAESNK